MVQLQDPTRDHAYSDGSLPTTDNYIFQVLGPLDGSKATLSVTQGSLAGDVEY